jgi:hypothetical protein
MLELVIGVALFAAVVLIALSLVRSVALSRARRQAHVQGQTFDGHAELWGMRFRERGGDSDGGWGDGDGGGSAD